MLRILSKVVLIGTLISALWGCVDPNENKRVTPIEVEDWRDEIIYQVMIDRFANGDRNNDYHVDLSAPAAYHGGDYQGLIDKLGYLDKLGVTALWISPVVKNVEEDAGVDGYHGYWTQNFLEVNRHFGDLAKLRELVDACHKRGIKVILDIVTNHVGQLFYYDINQNGVANDTLIGSGSQSPISRTTEWDPDFRARGIQAFTSFGESGLAPIEWVWSPEINRVPPQPAEFANPDWYNRKGRVTIWSNRESICGELERCRAMDAGARAYDSWCMEFIDACAPDGIPQEERDQNTCADGLPTCNEYARLQEIKGDFPGGLKDIRTELPEVRQAMVEAYSYWIEAAGFDGFRIDTVKHVEHGFWKYFCPEIRKRAKIAGADNWFMFGEAFDGDDKLIGSYTYDQQLDSVFYFSQKFQVFDAVFKYNQPTRNIYNLWANRLPEGFDSDSATDGGARVKADTYEKYYSQQAHENGPTAATGRKLRPFEMAVNFIDNHDVPRFLYIDDGEPERRCAPVDGTCSDAKCDNADWATTALCEIGSREYRCDCDIAALHAALGLQFTMDGIPCIFYGTEQNFNGGNDPSNREDLWSSGYDTENVTFKWISRLSEIRKTYAPLRRGRLVVTWSTAHTGNEEDAGIFAFERQLLSAEGERKQPEDVVESDVIERVLVVVNASRHKVSATSESGSGGADMAVGFDAGTKLEDVLNNGQSVTVSADQTLRVSVDPLSIRIFVAR